MKKPTKLITPLAAALLLCSAAQAASIKYTFTFSATSVSASTSYDLVVPALLTGTNNFFATQMHFISAPAPGAILVPNFPAVVGVNASGTSTAAFAGSGRTCDFTGLTAPLKSLGTFSFQTGSDVIIGAFSRPVTGSVVIAPDKTQARTPEPQVFLLAGGGLLLLLCMTRRKKKLSPATKFL